MDFHDQLNRYFGHADLDEISETAFASGIERMRVDFGLETDGDRRFGLWTLLYMLGSAPDLDVAFEDASEREAARNFMDMIDRVEDEAPSADH